jgi:hypothetical protein
MNYNNKWILTVLSLTLFSFGQMSHAAPFYKWVDEKGATHYTQTPPPQKSAKKININTLAPSDSADASKNLSAITKSDLKDDSDLEQANDKAKIKASADAARRAKNAPQCQQLRASLAQLQSGRRLYGSDAKGERSYITDDQKASQIQQANTQIQKDCP